jgi:hypothetical protein
MKKFNNEQAVQSGKVRYWTNEKMEIKIAEWIDEYGYEIVEEITARLRKEVGKPLDFNVDAMEEIFRQALRN